MQFGSGLDPPFGSQILVPRSVVGGLRGSKFQTRVEDSGIFMFGRGSKNGGYFIHFFVVLTVMRGATVKVICQVLSENCG